MPNICFIITNNRHHVEIFLPVVKMLSEYPGYTCKVISLCELRGIDYPGQEFSSTNTIFVRPLTVRFRSFFLSAYIKTGVNNFLREMLRKLVWHSVLKRKFSRQIKEGIGLCVLPNDVAFPYNHICAVLKAENIPFLLVQEGIRFPLPGVSGDKAYGTGGAAAIAVWGKKSAAYFQGVGIPDFLLHLTGSPRLESMLKRDWQTKAEKIKKDFGLKEKNLLFISNPIDDLGFCTTKEKMGIVSDFIKGIAGLFDDPAFSLIIRLHQSEFSGYFKPAIRQFAFSDRIFISSSGPIFPLFILSKAAILLASTAGTEALLFGLPLGVIDIPGYGFVYDYVSSGTAVGLTSSKPIIDQVKSLLEPGRVRNENIRLYLEDSFATLDNAAERIAVLINELVTSEKSRL